VVLNLQANGFNIAYDHWHKLVHGSLPYERLLKKDEELRDLLSSIPMPKYVFTNADKKHAETCLRLLGIDDLFEVCPLILHNIQFQVYAILILLTRVQPGLCSNFPSSIISEQSLTQPLLCFWSFDCESIDLMFRSAGG